MSATPLDPLVADIPEEERRLLQRTDAIAARIATLMRGRKLNQTELAKKLKKPKSYVSRVLSGTVNLTLKTIAEFEAALGDDVVTVPAWEAPYPRRRRRSSTVTEPSPEVGGHEAASAREEAPATGLAAGLPDTLCERLEAVAAAQGTSVDALVTLWVTERLMGEASAPAEPVRLLTGAHDAGKTATAWHTVMDSLRSHFSESHAMKVSPPTGFSSSPLRVAGERHQRTCVDPNGKLVAANTFTSFDPDPDNRGR